MTNASRNKSLAIQMAGKTDMRMAYTLHASVAEKLADGCAGVCRYTNAPRTDGIQWYDLE